MNNFLDDYHRGGFWYAVGQVVIRFRWRHDLRRSKELWLDDMPQNTGCIVHTYAMPIQRLQAFCETLALGDYADLADEKESLEAIKVLGHVGFSNRELSFLRMQPIGNGLEGQCILFPSYLLNKVFETEDCKLQWDSQDRSKVPCTITIHYGQGEKPWWMEESWIKAHTDPIYQPPDPLNPFNQGGHYGYCRT